MFSAVAKKLVHQSQLTWEKKLCLRSRLRGFSCRKCVEVCPHQALTEANGDVFFDPNKCTGCGSCAAVCCNDAFSFEGLHIKEEVEKNLNQPNLVVSCHRCDHTSNHEVRIPCVGILSEEFLVYLGFRRQEDTFFSLTGCAACQNRVSSQVFLKQLRYVQKKVGHLFPARIQIVQAVENLPNPKQPDRRKFLFSLGSNAAEIVTSQLVSAPAQTPKTARGRRIPARVQLLLRLLQDKDLCKDEVVDSCAPNINVSGECTLCPRCTGMCPTGALKVRKEGGEKVLSYDRRQCAACGLCVEFCKEKAVSMSEASIRFDRAAAQDKVLRTSTC